MIIKRLKNHEDFNKQAGVKRENNFGTLGLLCDDSGNFLCNTLELGLHADGRKISLPEIVKGADIGVNGRINSGLHSILITGSRKATLHDDWVGVAPGSFLMPEILNQSQAFASLMYRDIQLRQRFYVTTQVETSSGKQTIKIDDSYIKQALATQIIPHVGCLSATYFGISEFGVPLTQNITETIDGDSYKFVPGAPYIAAYATYGRENLHSSHKGQLYYNKGGDTLDGTSNLIAPGNYETKLKSLQETLVTRAGTFIPTDYDRYCSFNIRFHPGSEPWWSGGCVLLGIAHINTQDPSKIITATDFKKGRTNAVMDHIYNGNYFFERFGPYGENWSLLKKNEYMRKTHYAINDGFFFNGKQKHNYLLVVDEFTPLKNAVLFMQAMHKYETGQTSDPKFDKGEDAELIDNIVTSISRGISQTIEAFSHVTYDDDASLKTYLSRGAHALQDDDSEGQIQFNNIYSYA